MEEVVLWIGIIIGIIAGMVQILAYLHDHVGFRLPYKKQKSLTGGESKSIDLIPIKDININDCETPIINGFGEVWNKSQEVRNILKCPPSLSDIEKSTEIGVVYFERGVILCLKNDGQYSEGVIYILFDDDKSFYRINLSNGSKENTEDFEKFSRKELENIYGSRTDLQVRKRLGEQVREFSMSSGAYQKFRDGRMLWIGSTNDIIIAFESYPNPKLSKQWRRYNDVV